VSRINSAGTHLLALISDILDLSKIEAGRIEIFLEPVDADRMIDEVAETVQALVAENDNTLAVDVEPLGTIYTDQTKVRQIVINLLSNAAKFTSGGDIRLRARRSGVSDQEWLELEVSDTGIGMSKEQAERVFDAFTQADASTTRRFGGTGLGLAITKRFCELLGGEIGVASEEGTGSTFSVRVPVDARLAMGETT
jgi:signal transduction histidine kinase